MGLGGSRLDYSLSASIVPRQEQELFDKQNELGSSTSSVVAVSDLHGLAYRPTSRFKCRMAWQHSRTLNCILQEQYL